MFDNSEDERIGVDGVPKHVHLKARVPSSSDNESSAPSSPADPSSSAISASTETIPSAPTTTIAEAETFTTIQGAYIPSTDLSVESGRPKSFERIEKSEYIPTTQSPNIPSDNPSAVQAEYLPTFTTIPGAYVPTTTPGAYVPTTQQPGVVTTITLPNGPSGDIPTFTTTPEAYIPTQPPLSDSIAGPSNGGEALPTDVGAYASTGPANAGTGLQFATIPTSTIDDPNAMATSLVPVATYTSDGVAVVVSGSPSKISLVPVSTYTSNGVALVVMGSPSKTSLVPVSTYTSNGSAFVVMGTPSETSLVPVSTMTSNGVVEVVLGHPTSQPITSAVLSSGYSVVVEPVTSTSGSVAYVYMTTMTLGPSQTASRTTTTAAPQNTASTTSDQQTTTIAFTNMSYFAAWYLPTIIAVAFRVLWTIVYNNARMMEPFYRLASPAGVTGKHALDNL